LSTTKRLNSDSGFLPSSLSSKKAPPPPPPRRQTLSTVGSGGLTAPPPIPSRRPVSVRTHSSSGSSPSLSSIVHDYDVSPFESATELTAGNQNRFKRSV
jgi:hypothetical protein